MGRIGLEKLVAHLRDVFGYETKSFTLVGDAALVLNEVIKEVDKPVLMVCSSILNSIATQRGIPVKEVPDEVYGKVKSIDMGTALLITPVRLPKFHCVEDIGPFKTETLSTVIMLLLLNGIDNNRDKLTKCFERGGTLLLNAWYSDIDSITANYSNYPEKYDIIDDDVLEVVWKSLDGIEVAKDDHIFLEYVGMMYVETN